jgi:hypothetical protein
MSTAGNRSGPTAWRRWLARQAIGLAAVVLFVGLVNGLRWCLTPRPEFGFLAHDPCRVIKAVAYSPDGRLLSAGGTAGPRSMSEAFVPSRVRVWDADGNVVAEFEEAAGEVTSLAFAPDGRTLAWASRDGSVKLGNVASGAHVGSIPAARVHQVGFLPDGGLLTAGDGGVHLWEAPAARVRTTFSTHKAARFAHCPATDRLAFATFDGQGRPEPVEACDTRTAARSAVADPIPSRNQYVNYVRALAFSPDGGRLVVGMDQGLWSIDTAGEAAGKPRPVGGVAPVWAAAYTPDGTLVAVVGRPGGDMMYRGLVLNATTRAGTVLPFEQRLDLWHPLGHSYSRTDGQAYCVAVSPTATRLALGGELKGGRVGVYRVR